MEQTTKYLKMDKFLKQIENFAQQNPNKNIDQSTIYSYMIENFSKETPRGSNNVFFDTWENNFLHLKNISCFVAEEHPNWCQFVNADRNIPEKEVKLYIPLDFYHINKGVQILFTYLEKKNIYHHSKVFKKTRNDDVVIRVFSMEDAIDIINFVSSNQYLQEGLIETNPFVINENGVGITLDQSISYNYEVCNLISSYVNMQTKDFNSISIEGFHNYVVMMAREEKNNNKKLIYKILSRSTTKTGNINDISEIYNLVQRNSYQFDFFEEKKELSKISSKSITTEDDIKKEAILLNASLQNLKKYGVDSLKVALKADDPSFKNFTRDNDARKTMTENFKPYQIPFTINRYLNKQGFVLDKEQDIYSLYVNVVQEAYNKIQS